MIEPVSGESTADLCSQLADITEIVIMPDMSNQGQSALIIASGGGGGFGGAAGGAALLARGGGGEDGGGLLRGAAMDARGDRHGE